MFCAQCGTENNNANQFCSHCGEVQRATTVGDVVAKCANCGYVGGPQKARGLLPVILVWLVAPFAFFVPVIYFVTTHKYKCAKCASTFIGLRNHDGVFVAQHGNSRIANFFIVLLIIAVCGIFLSVLFAGLNNQQQRDDVLKKERVITNVK